MALMPCRECGKSVADSAATCPHCGVELRKRTVGFLGESGTTMGCANLGCLLILVFGGALLYLAR